MECLWSRADATDGSGWQMLGPEKWPSYYEPLLTIATNCDLCMVRRGSTVRVRQRA